MKIKLALVFLIILIIQFLLTLHSFANFSTTSKIDVVFILDASGSMKQSDPDNIRLEAMKMFIDMCELGRTQVGIVTFSHIIIEEKEMFGLNSAEDKSELKRYINNIPQNKGDTDIGLALKTGMELLESKHNPENSQFIILLSDGKTDIRSSLSKRTIADSEKDVNDVIVRANREGCPIYTIGLNYNGSVDEKELEHISQGSGENSCYITKTASDLPDILNNIFARHIGTKFTQVVEAMVADGKMQRVDFDIPDSTVLAANVIFISNRGVKEVHLYNPSGNELPIPSNSVIYSSGSMYSIYKILYPEKGTWIIEFKGVYKDKIEIDLILSRDFVLKLDARPDGVIAKGTKIEITAYLASENNQNINDREIYNTSTTKLDITDLDNGMITKAPLYFDNNVFSYIYELPENHSYSFSATLTSGNLNFKSDIIELKYDKSLINQQSKNQQSTSHPSSQSTSVKSKTSIWIPIIIIGSLLLITVIILVLKKIKPLKFQFGMLTINVTGNDIRLSPKTWDLGARSATLAKQGLDEILDYMSGISGGNCDDIMPRNVASKVIFRPERSGGLLIQVSQGVSVIYAANKVRPQLYLLNDGDEAELGFNGNIKVIASYRET
jgi:Ca-activated chloride channel homolog